jgi:hypothetical protein
LRLTEIESRIFKPAGMKPREREYGRPVGRPYYLCALQKMAGEHRIPRFSMSPARQAAI